MGKLHKIRKAFEQLSEPSKKDMAGACYNWYVVFNDGRATISKAYPRPGRAKFRAHWPYLRALLVEYGYVKKRPKPYTRTVRARIKYTNLAGT